MARHEDLLKFEGPHAGRIPYPSHPLPAIIQRVKRKRRGEYVAPLPWLPFGIVLVAVLAIVSAIYLLGILVGE